MCIRDRYTKTGGSSATATIEKRDGRWTVTSGDAADFDVDNATTGFILKASAVKDMVPVSVRGENKAGLSSAKVNATPLRDDSNLNDVIEPTINEPTQDRPHHTVQPGGDNTKVDVTYTPNVDQNPKEKTITATLEQGGKWSLKDSDGLPVDDAIATVDANGVITIKEPLEGKTKVKAKGYDSQGSSDLVESNPTPAEAAPAKPAPGQIDPNAGTGQAGANDGTGKPLPELIKPSEKYDDDQGSDEKPSDPKNGTDKHRSANARAKFKQTDDNDADAYIEFTQDRPESNYEMHFTVYDMEANEKKGFVVTAVRQGGKTIGFTYETGSIPNKDAFDYLSDRFVKNRETISPEKSGYLIIPEISNGEFTGNVYVMSNDKYRLVADSPAIQDTGDSNRYKELFLSSKDKSQDGSDYSVGAGGSAINLHNYDATRVKPNTPPAVTGALEKSQSVELEAVSGGDTQGSVLIKPKGDVAYPLSLSVRYIDEHGQPQTALLKKQDASGQWSVAEGNQAAFDLGGAYPRIKAEFLNDRQEKGVTVKATEHGKLPSDAVFATPSDDPAPVEPPKPAKPPVAVSATENSTVFDDVESNSGSNPTHTFVGNDILSRLKDSQGLKALASSASRGGMIVNSTWDRTTITTKPAGGTDKDVILVDGSLGDTALGIFKVKRQPFTVDLGSGDDILALKNSLGDNKSKGEDIVKLGEGNNLLTVGTGGDNFKLKENLNATDPAKRYEFVKHDVAAKDGEKIHTQLEQSGGTRDTGGAITYTTVQGGSGNDVIAVEGDVTAMRGRDRGAIGAGAKIDLGAGDDAIIIADQAAVTTSRRGEVADGAVVDFGTGNDYLKAVGIREGSQVTMGEGNDTVVVDRILSDNTVLDMGSGNDTLKIGTGPNSGEARNNAKINLGAGDDTIHFKASSNLWGEPLKHEARFMAKLDGGAGYDTFVLETPDQINMGSSVYKSSISHLSTKYFKNIEEIRMAKGTVVDISIGDLWDKAANASGVALKINGYAPEGDQLRPSTERQALNTGNPKTTYRVVDLGETNTNTGTETYAPSAGTNGKFNGYDRVGTSNYWQKLSHQETEQINGETVTYNVYRFGDTKGYDIWIQDGINVI